MDELPHWTPAMLALQGGIPASTARRWRHRLPPWGALLIRLLIGRELELLDPAFRGWALRDGKLVSPEGWAFSPGEVLSVPLMRGQIRLYQNQLRFNRQADWIEGKYLEPDETRLPEGPDRELRSRGCRRVG